MFAANRTNREAAIAAQDQQRTGVSEGLASTLMDATGRPLAVPQPGVSTSHASDYGALDPEAIKFYNSSGPRQRRFGPKPTYGTQDAATTEEVEAPEPTPQQTGGPVKPRSLASESYAVPPNQTIDALRVQDALQRNCLHRGLESTLAGTQSLDRDFADTSLGDGRADMFYTTANASQFKGK
eukprot:m51a1_g14708 hypothetical protein (182) ;mRNA; r:151385-152062